MGPFKQNRLKVFHPSSRPSLTSTLVLCLLFNALDPWYLITWLGQLLQRKLCVRPFRAGHSTLSEPGWCRVSGLLQGPCMIFCCQELFNLMNPVIFYVTCADYDESDCLYVTCAFYKRGGCVFKLEP